MRNNEKGLEDMITECHHQNTFRRNKGDEHYCLLGNNDCKYQGKHYVVVGERTPQFYLECKRKK